jgi:hypothetical protein
MKAVCRVYRTTVCFSSSNRERQAYLEVRKYILRFFDVIFLN